MIGSGYYSSADTLTPGTGYTVQASDSSARSFFEDQIVSSIQSSVTIGFSTSGSNTKQVVGATFKQAGGGGGAVVHKLPVLGAGA